MNVWMDTCVYICSGAMFISYDMYGDQTTMWKTYFSLSALWIPGISQVFRLGTKCLYSLCHPTSPESAFFLLRSQKRNVSLSREPQ